LGTAELENVKRPKLAVINQFFNILKYHRYIPKQKPNHPSPPSQKGGWGDLEPLMQYAG
jgi:hypothetical protein